MPEQGTDILAHFGQDRFIERFQRYQAHIAEWRQQYPKLSAVDLRYDQQVVLQMASGAPDALADPDAAANAGTSTAPAQLKPQAGQLAASETQVADLKAAPDMAPDKQSSTRSAANSPAAKKNKPAQNKKKHTDVKRAALNAGRRKPASNIPQAAAAGSHSAAVMAQGG
jgi:cell division protein FtsQ